MLLSISLEANAGISRHPGALLDSLLRKMMIETKMSKCYPGIRKQNEDYKGNARNPT